MPSVVFVESSVVIAYIKGRKDVFNPGAVMLYEKLRDKKGRGIITETVRKEVTSKLNRLIAEALRKGNRKLANSFVKKRGKFLECVEVHKVGGLQLSLKFGIVDSILGKVSLSKLQEVMLKKGRKTLHPEPKDKLIAAEVLALKDEIEAENFYVASTDQDFTYLLRDGLGEFSIIVDFPSSIARKL